MQTEDDIDITDQSNYASMMKMRLDQITKRNVQEHAASATTGSAAGSSGIMGGSTGSVAGVNGSTGSVHIGSGIMTAGGSSTSRARSSVYNRGKSAAPAFGAHSAAPVKKVSTSALTSSSHGGTGAGAGHMFPKARGLIPK